VYYVLPRRPQNYWLLFVSYAFYASWAWKFCLILLGLTVANFFLAKQFQKSERNKAGLLWLGIALNVITLLFFRTADFFLPGFISLLANLGINISDHSIQLLLPIGLAYYSLQNISYLIDVYRKQMAAATDFIDFALYLAYFPKLLAGPIERARTFLPKLVQSRRVDNNMFVRSLTLIIIGLVRKLFIAGVLSAIIFWDAFETPTKYTGPELIGWLLIYGLYLYNDFGGYTSIARGISGLFGLELSNNFKQPYFARNLTEFWNSWHISLSNWLRDYVYFPLSRLLHRSGADQHKLSSLILPPMVTMLVSGLWHGLSWHMLLWGGLHGSYQVIERLASLRKPIEANQDLPFWRQGLGMLTVFILVSFAWVPFVMDVPVALAYWRGMFDWTYVIRFRRIFLFIPFFILVLAIDWLQRRYQDEEFFLRWPLLVQASLLAVSLFLILILLQGDIDEPFVYQGF
jgi:D-alanyl-lipoteichoic acid acyltransferase DltB (MBOAT superfamily)